MHGSCRCPVCQLLDRHLGDLGRVAALLILDCRDKTSISDALGPVRFAPTERRNSLKSTYSRRFSLGYPKILPPGAGALLSLSAGRQHPTARHQQER